VLVEIHILNIPVVLLKLVYENEDKYVFYFKCPKFIIFCGLQSQNITNFETFS